MLKNFWWPLDFTPEVTAKPKRVTALGQELVLFRTPDGKPQVMSDLCVHRGVVSLRRLARGRLRRVPLSRLEIQAGWRVRPHPGQPAERPGPAQGPGRFISDPGDNGWAWAFPATSPRPSARPSPTSITSATPISR